MKRQIFFATAFSAALAVGAAAQTGTGAQTGAQQQQREQTQQVTMTGCLERASQGTAGTAGTGTGTGTGTAARSGAGTEFILSNAKPGSGSTGTAGTAGTGTGAASSSAMGNKYRLQGGDREDLEKHLNSQVEIRGTLDRSSSSPATGAGTGTGTGTAATGARAGQTDIDKLPVLRVTSVRQISATCTSGN